MKKPSDFSIRLAAKLIEVYRGDHISTSIPNTIWDAARLIDKEMVKLKPKKKARKR